MIQNNVKEVIDKLLVDRLSKFISSSPTDAVCLEIYLEIFKTIEEIILNVPKFAEKATHDCVNFIAQAYYDMILLNNSETLNPNIFDKRVKVSDLSNTDLVLCSPFLQGTDVFAEIAITLKKRS